MFWWIAGGLLVYCAGCYFLVWKMMTGPGGAGPAGLGWLVFPFAPILPPLIIGSFVMTFLRGVYHTVVRIFR